MISEGYPNVYSQARGPDHPIKTMGPNSIIGELAFFDAGPRTHSLQALTDGIAYKLSVEDFDKLARTDPEIAINFMRDISEVLANRFRSLLAKAVSHELPTNRS